MDNLLADILETFGFPL